MAVQVARLDEIPNGEGIRRTIDGREVAIFRVGEEAYAIDAVCPHRHGPLDGPLEDTYIAVCPWHCWAFDIRTGKSPMNPARVFCHHVTIEDGVVSVELSC